MFSYIKDILKPSDLWNAARRGDIEAIRKLVAEGADVNTKKQTLDVNTKKQTLNVPGWTPIHFAAFYKQGEAIKKLVDLGAKINVRDDEGDTPMVLAVQNGADTALVDLMIEVGADLNKGATSSLQTAASLGNEQLVQHLLSLGANPKELTNKSVAGPLWSAVGSGNIAVVQMLLKAGAEVNSDPKKENALDAAAMDGNLEIVRILLAAGADPNHKDSQERTPLMSAVFSKKNQVVQILLATGADVNAKSTDERTALDRAEREKLTDIINLLKQAGAKRGSELPRELDTPRIAARLRKKE